MISIGLCSSQTSQRLEMVELAQMVDFALEKSERLEARRCSLSICLAAISCTSGPNAYHALIRPLIETTEGGGYIASGNYFMTNSTGYSLEVLDSAHSHAVISLPEAEFSVILEGNAWAEHLRAM